MSRIAAYIKQEIMNEVIDLTGVAIKNRVAIKINSLASYISHNTAVECVKQYLSYKTIISDILACNLVTKKFAHKFLSISSKYQIESKLIDYRKSLYYDPYFAREVYSSKEKRRIAFEF